MVAVDTSSRDESVDLLAAAFGEPCHRSGLRPRSRRPSGSGSTGCARRRPPEWVWLLHDDANPDPGALAALLAAAAAHPTPTSSARSCASGRRCAGCSSSASPSPAPAAARPGWSAASTTRASTTTSARCSPSTPPACWSAATVLEELGGFDQQLPIFGNDIDFGWRAAARRPHAPWSSRRRSSSTPRPPTAASARTPLTGRHTHYQERRAALYTLLANSPAGTLPLQVRPAGLRHAAADARLLAGASPGEALDELAALVSVYSSPAQILAARRGPPAHAVERPGPSPRGTTACWRRWWLPYRHGLDFVGDSSPPLTNQAADVAERRRAAAAERTRRRWPPRAPPRPATEDDDARRLRGHRAGRPVPDQPGRPCCGAVRRPRAGGARDGVRRGHRRRRSSPAPDCRRRLVAPAPRVLAPARRRAPTCRRRRTCCRSLLAARSSAQTRPRLSAASCSRCRSRSGAPGGSCGWSADWSARRARRAGCSLSGASTYALVPVVSRCLGRGTARHGGRGRAAALARARRPGLRRPRGRPPLAGRLAVRGAARPHHGVRARRLAVRRWSSAWPWSRPPPRSCPQRVREPSVWGPPAAAVGAVPVLLSRGGCRRCSPARAGLLLDAGRLPRRARRRSRAADRPHRRRRRPGVAGWLLLGLACWPWCRG